MATVGANNLTLLDITKRLEPDGKHADIAELLTQDNAMLLDMPWVEGNLPTGHMSTIRTGLPTAAFRKLYGGVQSSKSTTAQVVDSFGMLEAESTVDRDLLKLQGNKEAYRLGESKAFLEAMNQRMQNAVLYGDSTLAPEEFNGLTLRFSDIGAGSPANAENIIDGGGTGSDNSSIWLIGWSPDKVFGTYPKGSMAGLHHEDKGEHRILDAAGNPYWAVIDHYKWDAGLVVKDWRYVVRIANIDISDLTKNAATGADLIDLMTRAISRLQSTTGCTPVFYVNRTIESFLRRQQANFVKGSTLTMDDVFGKKVLHASGIPVRRVDALTELETRVT